MASGRLAERKIETRIPIMVDADGFYTGRRAGLPQARSPKKGDRATPTRRSSTRWKAVGRADRTAQLKHQYPHSWRSKKPVIFRNTPQWFMAMDKAFDVALPEWQRRAAQCGAMEEITKVSWEPAAGENRITGMIAAKPDWVMSRQRAWACRSPSS